MIKEPITEFYVFQSNLCNTEDYVAVAVRKDDFKFRCWSTNNRISSILEIAQFLFADHRFGWSGTADYLGTPIVTYSIESHPEYFL